MKRVYLALPDSDDVTLALRDRLTRKKSAKRLEVVDDLGSAQVVVTSTDDLGMLPEQLPPSVELLQLIDCGGGKRYLNAPGLAISNASDLFYINTAGATAVLVIESCEDVEKFTQKQSLRLGVVGMGSLGNQLLEWVFVLVRLLEDCQLRSILINDVRIPTEDSFSRLQGAFDEVDIYLSWGSLDEILTTSDIVVVAVHRGPAAEPLLGAREANMLDPDSWVIDVSEEGVVDQSAFDPVSISGPLPTYIRFDEVQPHYWQEKMGIDLETKPKSVAKYVAWNLRRFAKGRRISAMVPVPPEQGADGG